MKKYIREVDNSASHWTLCEKNKAPYIKVTSHKEGFSEIFFDITNICNANDIEEISEKLKKIYENYLEFFLINEPWTTQYIDSYYFNLLAVKIEHTDYLAQSLFDFLNQYTNKINN